MCDLVFLDDDEKLCIPDMLSKTFEELVDLFPYYTEMNSYKVRIDIHQPRYGNISVQQCLDVFEDSDIYMYAVEKLGTDNPHFQALVVTSVRRDTMVARIKKLGAVGQGYSFKKANEQWPMEYIAYLMKECEPEYHNFPEEVRIAGVKRNDMKQSEYRSKKLEKKATKVWRKIRELIPADFDYCDPQAKFHVMKAVVKYHKDNETLIRSGSLVAYMDTIMINCGGEFYENSYIYNLINK